MDIKNLQLSVFLEQVEIFECQRCFKMFGDQILLDYHMLSHNEQLNMFDTSRSLVTFDAKVVLDRVPIYECRDCTRGFLSDWDYQSHKMQHLKQRHNFKSQTPPPAVDGDDNDDKYRKIYDCEDCDARFVLYSTLLAHTAVHQPFGHTCHCGVGFYKKQDLKIHQRLVHKQIAKEKTTWIPKINLSIETIMRQKPKKPRSKVAKSERYDETVEEEEETGEIDIGPPLPNGRPRLNRKFKYRKPTYLMTATTSETTSIASSVQYKNNDEDPDKDTKEVDDSNEDATGEPSSVKKGPKLRGELVYKSSTKKKRKKSPDNKTHECPVCNKIFKQGNLKRHTMEVHGTDKPHKCDDCGKCYSMGYLLKSHKKLKHSGVKMIIEKKKPSYPCTVCNKVLTSSHNLASHTMLHNGESRHECEICGKKFVNTSVFNMHKKKHESQRYPCPTCGKEFALLHYMQNHMRIHLEVKPFSCEFCSKRFADPSALQRHRRLHTGEKPYKCKFCPKRFSDASAHIVHVRRHTGDKNFKCEWCHKHFYVLSNLKLHITALHGDGDRNFQCDLCQKSFLLKQYLATHMKVSHLDTKRQKCKYCSKKLNSFYMKSHLHKEHDVRSLPPVKLCTELVKNEM